MAKLGYLVRIGILTAAVALLLGVTGGGPRSAAAAGETSGCYQAYGVSYFFDGATWYILVGDGAGGATWWTWDQYVAQTGAGAPETLESVYCSPGLSYPVQGVVFYLDGDNVWWISTDKGWMTYVEYVLLRLQAEQQGDSGSWNWDMGEMDPSAWIGNQISQPWTQPNCEYSHHC